MSTESKGAVAVILAIGIALALVFGGIALIFSQGASQSCARAEGVWIATDVPGEGNSVERERRCER